MGAPPHARLVFLPMIGIAAAVAIALGAFIHVSPTVAARGSVVVFTGGVAGGCARGDQVTLISPLFPGHAFGGSGAVTTRVGAAGHFTKRFRIGATTARKTYLIGARCGGGNLGVDAKLRVR